MQHAARKAATMPVYWYFFIANFQQNIALCSINNVPSMNVCTGWMRKKAKQEHSFGEIFTINKRTNKQTYKCVQTTTTDSFTEANIFVAACMYRPIWVYTTIQIFVVGSEKKRV